MLCMPRSFALRAAFAVAAAVVAAVAVAVGVEVAPLLLLAIPSGLMVLFLFFRLLIPELLERSRTEAGELSESPSVVEIKY